MDLDGLLSEVEAQVAFDARSLLDESLCQRKVRLERLKNLVAVADSMTVGELEARKATDVLYGSTTAQWIAHRCKVPVGVARRQVKTAVKLAQLLPEVHAAWATGSINEEHVRVFHQAANPRIKAEIAKRQAELIALACEYSFHQWRQIMANLVAVLDEDGAFDPDAETERNTAHFTATLDGSCSLAARFDRVTYATIRHLVEAKADELFRYYAQRTKQSGGELPTPSRPTLRALAIYELIVAGAAAGTTKATVTDATVVLTPDLAGRTHHATDTTTATETGDAAVADDSDHPESTMPVEADSAPTSNARRDTDLEGNRASGPNTDTDGASDRDTGTHRSEFASSSATADQAEPEPDCDHAAASGLPDSAPPDAGQQAGPSGLARVGGWRAWTLDGLLLPGASTELATKLCDARFQALVVDADGLPLSMGRAVRLFQDHQRKAIAIRDGGCVAPGCTMPIDACDFHHVRWWDRDQGPTDVINGAGMCGRDHGMPHRAGWDMFITNDAWTWFRTPSGLTFWGQRHGRQRTGPTPDHPDYIPRPIQPIAARPPPNPGDAPLPPSTAAHPTAPPSPTLPGRTPTAPTPAPSCSPTPARCARPNTTEHRARSWTALEHARTRIRTEHERHAAVLDSNW